MIRVILLFSVIFILACGLPVASAYSNIPNIEASTPTPTVTTYPTFTVTPVRLDVVGCWNVRSSPSAADDTNILRTVCDKDVYYIGWSDNGFIEIFPLGDGREYICNQAVDSITKMECK